MANYSAIPTDLFVFLRELSENNDKQWFTENKARFRENLQLPMVGFIEAMAPWLELNAPAFVADTRLNGGSLFRIYRDTRFGNDKTPYFRISMGLVICDALVEAERKIWGI